MAYAAEDMLGWKAETNIRFEVLKNRRETHHEAHANFCSGFSFCLYVIECGRG